MIRCDVCGREFKARGIKVHLARSGCGEKLSNLHRKSNKSKVANILDSSQKDVSNREEETLFKSAAKAEDDKERQKEGKKQSHITQWVTKTVRQRSAEDVSEEATELNQPACQKGKTAEENGTVLSAGVDQPLEGEAKEDAEVSQAEEVVQKASRPGNPGVKSGWGEKLGVTPLGGLSDDALPQPIDDMPDRFPGRVGPGQGLWL